MNEGATIAGIVGSAHAGTQWHPAPGALPLVLASVYGSWGGALTRDGPDGRNGSPSGRDASRALARTGRMRRRSSSPLLGGVMVLTLGAGERAGADRAAQRTAMRTRGLPPTGCARTPLNGARDLPDLARWKRHLGAGPVVLVGGDADEPARPRVADLVKLARRAVQRAHR